LIDKAYFFIVKVIHEQQQDVELMVADPNHLPYNFRPVDAPTKHLRHHSYTIVDTSEGQVFLHMNHYSSNTKFGNIYISDRLGVEFSNSLAHVVRDH
jgi:hypothetical protein